ncbi:hypothetical protein DRO64_11300 [Candidatus Bathyarchaeota archaeon]|nr:MAG: hypothetical protein DRO64_11300 [Candidatus Bathyarchaeota archaeon]
MSREYRFILTYAERFIGLLFMLIGIILTYNTYSNWTAAGWGAEYFMAIGVALTIVGILMLIVKLK